MLKNKLKDPTLLRQKCYIDGAWHDADSGQTIDVNNPATGGNYRYRSKNGRR